MSRKEQLSYNHSMAKVPAYLNRYFHTNNFILVYPMQRGVDGGNGLDFLSAAVAEPFERWDDIGKTIARLFSKK